MLAHALREAGILVLVFAPLYLEFEPTPNSVNPSTFYIMMGLGVLFLLLGVVLERVRRER